jgi:PPOX class probable F420-dependent enzyme
MTTLADVARLLALDHGLCVVSTTRGDGTVQSSLVNAGVLPHPTSGTDVLGFVAQGRARKLVNLRARSPLTAVARSGWEWAAVEGTAQLIGPDDPEAGVDAEGIRLLLRAVFSAAGGTHDDWDEFDRVMADERRTAVLVTPRRVYSNG